PVLDQLLALVNREQVEGVDPCGSVMQDIPGTAQGCWFLSGNSETYPEDPHLALVHDNVHPSQAVFSVGISVPNLESRTYEFPPQSSGLLNRDFSDITPDGQIYGFQTEGFSGAIIVKMPDAETLWIEAIEGGGTSPSTWSFTSNKAIFKR
ncbi:MAG: hypothetical protein J7L90_03755, partial [Dehalococcoidia bacterium]|nr:hypothetical protein [Dehalococcoidia bacterium]